jgi:acyl-coenzyme A synthetase/AMP-(fatty) acid ligase
MNYSFGLSIINSHLHVGGSILMTEESLTQRRFWELFKDFKVTSLSGVPYTYEMLKKFRLLNSELPSLKTLTQAGGKLSNDLVEYFSNISKSKGLNFFVMYGQTEGTARLSYLNPELVQEKLGSIGRPIPGGDFFLIDDRGNKINKALVSGELVYTGANVMLGYSFCLNDLSLGNENNGFLKTGDIAFFDKNELFFIVGRISRFIKIFGNRINLDEVENLLLEKGLQTACKGHDNFLIIYVLKSDQMQFAIDFINKKLGIHLTAFEVRIIDEIPKSASGKILYSKLSD